MRKTFFYEAFDVTTGTVKYRQRHKGNAAGKDIGDAQANSSRKSEIGYLYMLKPLYIELHRPEVLKIIIEVASAAENPFPEYT